MRSKAPNFTPKRTRPKLTHNIAGFVLVFVWTWITPAVFGQQDVHAALIPSANRKPAPAFQLVTEAGTKMRISDYRGKVLLLNFWATGCGVLEIPSYIELGNIQGQGLFRCRRLAVALKAGPRSKPEAAAEGGRLAAGYF